MTDFDRDFFSPHDMKVLYVAIDRARTIVGAAALTHAENPLVAYVLAKAILVAAERGECNAARLSEAACVQFAGTSGAARAAGSFALH